MITESCVFCGEDWYSEVDGYAIIGKGEFHACINCILNLSWEEMEFDVEELYGA